PSCAVSGVIATGRGDAGMGFAAAWGAAGGDFGGAWSVAEDTGGWPACSRDCVALCADFVAGGDDGVPAFCNGVARPRSKLKSMAGSVDGSEGFSGGTACGWSEGISLGEMMSPAIASVATESNGLAPVNSTASSTAAT